MTDVLYEFENQFREKRAIWRLFELAPLRLHLARGRIFRWFAINIPLHLIDLQGDIDLLMSLRAPPRRGSAQIYESWEIKTTLVSQDGHVFSSKNSDSKKRQMLGQLRRYRHAGSPCQGLLDLFIYQDKALEKLGGPPREILHLMFEKAELLIPEQFGYRVIHFAHVREHEIGRTHEDFLGLRTVTFPPPFADHAPTFIQPASSAMHEPFSQLAILLENFVKEEINQERTRYGKCIVTYCYDCRRLTTVSPASGHKCTFCASDLTLQKM